MMHNRSKNPTYQISIIIPVFREMHIINTNIERLYAMRFSGRFEVIIVDGDPTGSTLDVIDSGDVKKIVASKGRGLQMNAGAAIAHGKILLFLHADTLLLPDALDRILLAMKQKNAVGGAFHLGIDSDRKSFRIIEKAVKLRSRFTQVPYGDQAIFMERIFFLAVGGFKDIPIMEDVELMRRIKKKGKKICIIPQPVLTSPRRWEMEGLIFCTVRNWILLALYLLGVSPFRLSRFYAQINAEKRNKLTSDRSILT